MVINYNIAQVGAHNSLHISNSAMLKSIEKLSKGLRINRALSDMSQLT